MNQQLIFWTCKNTKNTFYLSSDDIVNISHEIVIRFGGFLEKGTSVQINEKILISSFDHIVISGHLCAIISKLGEGAFGKIYKGYDYQTSRYIAIKVQPNIFSNIIGRQAAVTKKHGIGCSDPRSNVGPTFLRNGYGYFIIPLADSNYLEWISKKSLNKEYKIIIQSLIDIAKNLIKLHSQKLVHMDIKMDNILVVKNKAYLSDFGKVEKESEIIPSAQGSYKQYSHCDPNYFMDYSKNLFYTVSYKFDLYSFSKVIYDTSCFIKSHELRLELTNISKHISQFNPNERVSLIQIIQYLENINKNL